MSSLSSSLHSALSYGPLLTSNPGHLRGLPVRPSRSPQTAPRGLVMGRFLHPTGADTQVRVSAAPSASFPGPLRMSSQHTPGWAPPLPRPPHSPAAATPSRPREFRGPPSLPGSAGSPPGGEPRRWPEPRPPLRPSSDPDPLGHP